MGMKKVTRLIGGIIVALALACVLGTSTHASASAESGSAVVATANNASAAAMVVSTMDMDVCDDITSLMDDAQARYDYWAWGPGSGSPNAEAYMEELLALMTDLQVYWRTSGCKGIGG